MSRYFKFVWAGIFLCPAPIYWVMLGLVIIIFAIGLIENGKSVPYKIFYTDEQTNKRTEIPAKNVTIQHISDSIYEIYVRIKRQDGDGYDYAIAKLKKCSDTEYRTVKVEVGREVI